MKNLAYALLAIVLLATSCKKDLNEISIPNDANTDVAKSFREIKTNESFDWKTQKEVSIEVSGLKTMVPISNTLKVTSEDGKIVYYSGNHFMEENLSLKVVLPTNITAVKVNFGSVNKTILTANQTAQFNYLPEITEE